MSKPENKPPLAKPATSVAQNAQNAQNGNGGMLRQLTRPFGGNSNNAAKLKIAARNKAEELRVETVEHNSLRWINIERAEANEVAWLHQNFEFNPLHLEDVTGRLQRPKIDDYEDYLFIVLHFPVYSKTDRTTMPGEIDIFLGKDYIITVHDGNLRPLSKLFEQCKNNSGKRYGVLGRTAPFALYKIIDVLVDYCFPIVSKLSEKIDDIDEQIFNKTQSSNTILEISILRRDILAIRRIIRPQIPILANLERRKLAVSDDEDLEAYFSDITDHISKIWDSLEEFKDIIDGLSSTYDSLATHQLNQVIKALTIISVMMLPLTLISGLFGMNVPVPFQEDGIAFYGILIFLVILAAAMLMFFRLRKWL